MKFFIYSRAEKYVSGLETVSTAALQRKFQIGYAQASKIIDRLEADGKITRENGKWHVISGVRSGPADDCVGITDSQSNKRRTIVIALITLITCVVVLVGLISLAFFASK